MSGFGIPRSEQAAKNMTKREAFAVVALHALIQSSGERRVDIEKRALDMADQLLAWLDHEGGE